VYDRATSSLVDAQIQHGSSWVRMELAPRADLQESVFDNSAVDDSIAFDLIESNELPHWAASSVDGRSEPGARRFKC